MLKLYIGNNNYSSWSMRASAPKCTPSSLPGVQAWIDGALAEHDFLAFEEPYRLTGSGLAR